MKVLVTGGAGNIGKVVTAYLVERGYDVRVLGINEGVTIDGAEYVTCDILNYDGVLQHMRGCEAVVHLAAIPQPYHIPAPALFDINVSGTFRVFEAAAHAGIKRVVQASSINAIGFGWSIVDLIPAYFPIDEEHPRSTTDPYSFSKQLDEDIADYFWRREGISSVSLRFPWVYPPQYHKSDAYYEHRRDTVAFMDELAAQDPQTREARLAAGREHMLKFRGARSLESDSPDVRSNAGMSKEEALMHRAYVVDRFNFWSFLDARDAAQSIDKGLTADYDGSHALFINDRCNWLSYDSETLLALFYPDIKERKRPIPGADAIVSIDKARALIGFEPAYSVDMDFREN